MQADSARELKSSEQNRTRDPKADVIRVIQPKNERLESGTANPCTSHVAVLGYN